MKPTTWVTLIIVILLSGTHWQRASSAAEQCGECQVLVGSKCRWCYQEGRPCVNGKCVSTPDPLTMGKLRNAEYRSDMWTIGKIKLRDGKYENSKEHVSMWLSEKIALGDLNGDGIEDAAVVLVSSGGGSGTFSELIAVINQNGNPRQVAVRSLGDRVNVGNLSIRGGNIVVQRAKHAPGDPMCCPSLRVTEKHKLRGSSLLLSR